MGQKLGQHFLTSQKVIQESIAVADLSKGERVVEIGPGKGVLTRALLESGAHVTALEFDENLISFLQEEFSSELGNNSLHLIHCDALTFDTASLQEPYKVVANIPYYITGALLRHFLTSIHQPRGMVLLMQKEVAQRIVARDGKESLLSLSVKAYGKPRILRHVSRKLFSPPPKVDSSVLVVEHISRTFFENIDENTFFGFIRLGFSSKRKQLVNNLSSAWPKSHILEALDFLEIVPEVRAEDLSLGEWKSLLIQLLTRKNEV